MSTFSGTNLPPIVRLGGTADALMRLDDGTLYAVAPEHIRRASAVQTTAVSLPTKSIRVEDLIETESDSPRLNQQGRRRNPESVARYLGAEPPYRD